MTGKGYMKEASETNDAYVAEWEGDPWYPAIKEAHDLLSHFIPGYQITQIKTKFGGLRFYFVLPIDELPIPERTLYIALADAIVLQAEMKCEAIDRMIEYEKKKAEREAAARAEADEEE